jgi:hypothetical protein
MKARVNSVASIIMIKPFFFIFIPPYILTVIFFALRFKLQFNILCAYSLYLEKRCELIEKTI